MGAGAGRIVVNSRFTQAAFRQAFPSLPVIPSVLYPGVLVDSSKKQTEITSNSRCFLSLNRFERKKDVQLAIEALALMRNQQATLIVAGGFDPQNRENVDYLRELEALCDVLKLTHSRDMHPSDCQVRFALAVDEPLKANLMRTACALLYTPQSEHFGIVPVEAMSRGLPVIAMSSGGPKETVKAGESGWLCRERDPQELAALMDRAAALSSEERVRMSRAARCRVEKLFSMEAFARNLTSITQEMLNGP